MAFIEAKNLEKNYPDGTRAVRGVSFEINEGDFVSIMGPSGSGKSTLLHILGFLDKPSGGEYIFDGKVFDDFSPDEIAQVRNKKMGFVFQAFNLLPRTSVLENVKLPLLYSDVPVGKREGRARDAVESVGLSHRLEHETSELSGGEKQRVAIARALVNEPALIFADEPTGNLDSKSGEVVMEIVEKLNKKEGRTVILITHETYTAEYADRIITMLDGEIESDKKVGKRAHKDHSFKK